jgi:MFS family permease
MSDNPSTAISFRLQAIVYLSACFGGSLNVTQQVIMPLWALHLGASPIMIGTIVSARLFFVILFSIYGGAMVDRFGIRRMIILLSAITGILWALYPVFPFVWAAIVLQLISGFVESTAWIGSQALVGNHLGGRPIYAGRFTATIRVGSFAGPILIGIVWDTLGHAAAFLFLAAWALIGAGIAFFLPPDRVHPIAKPKELEKLEKLAPETKRGMLPNFSDYSSTFKLLTLAPVMLVIMNTFFRQTGSGIQNSFYGVWLDQIGFSASIIGLLIGVSNGFSAVSALSVGFLTRYINAHVLLLAATMTAVVAIAITPLFGTVLSALIIAIAFRGIGQGINFPMMISIASQAVSPAHQGRVAALRLSFNKLGGALVPILMGALVEVMGIENTFYLMGIIGVVTLSGVGIWVARSPAFKDDH